MAKVYAVDSETGVILGDIRRFQATQTKTIRRHKSRRKFTKSQTKFVTHILVLVALAAVGGPALLIALTQ